MDVAATCSLRVTIGLCWEQYTAFLRPGGAQRILRDVSKTVRRLAGPPAVLCYAVANEIPSSIVRWYCKTRIERFIGRLCAAVKSEDPAALVTYVNFPPPNILSCRFSILQRSMFIWRRRLV